MKAIIGAKRMTEGAMKQGHGDVLRGFLGSGDVKALDVIIAYPFFKDG